MKIYRISQDAQPLWDLDAMSLFGQEIQNLLKEIIDSGYHIKSYPLQSGINRQSITIYNEQRNFAIKVIVVNDFDSTVEQLKQFIVLERTYEN
jgi:hypothetical protein